MDEVKTKKVYLPNTDQIGINCIEEASVQTLDSAKSESSTIKSRVKNFLLHIWNKVSFAITNTFAEFCVTGAIHGIRHFHNKNWYEKLIFLVLFCFSIVSCMLIVRLIRYEWLDKPVILSNGHNSMTIKEIPFPAITICPQAKASHERFDCKKDHENFVMNLIVNQDL